MPGANASAKISVLGVDTLIFEEDTVLLDDTPITPRTEHFTAVLNKPKRTLSVARDPRGKGDLSPWLKQMPKGTFPVGRLDRDTTGLLLFTTSGDLANAVLRPERHTNKRYWLWLNESFEQDDPRVSALLRQDDARYDGAKAVRVVRRDPHFTELELVLDQGKHRQIRRMCRALDLRLLHLHRTAIGPLSDAGLSVGRFRTLSDGELRGLWDATGGHAALVESKISGLGRRAEELRRKATPDVRLERWLADHSRRAR